MGIAESGLEERNPGGGGGGSTSSTSTPPPHGPPPPADRISELPKEILHHILGFLEMNEFLIGTSLVSTKWRNLWKSVSNLKFPTCTDDDSVVVDNGGGGGTSLVSTKWRNLWKSVSTLNFPNCTSGGGGGIRNNVEKYQNFVDHVLRLRDSQASKIQIFRYYFDDDINYSRRREGGEGYDDLERLHKLIVSAVVNQGAQEIQIMGSSSYVCRRSVGNNMKMIHFNPSIFTSEELKRFSFEVFNDVYFQIQFPRSMCCATQLTHLTLFEIRLPEGDDESNAQLHLVSPVLEELVIRNCCSDHLKVLDVSAPGLNDLAIYNTEGSEYLGECRIEIRTPNLTRLVYSGFVYVDCFTVNLPHLNLASLNFSKETGMVEKATSFATKLLKGLTSARILILEGFEVFSQDTLRDLFTPFTSLTVLKLSTNCKISSIHGMVHILNNCNSIKKFVWKVDEKCTVEGDYEHSMLPQCRLSHLKHVRIEQLRGHKNEIEWVKFLLKNSVVLEDIRISTAMDSSKRSIEESLKQFIEDEPSVRRSIKLHILWEESWQARRQRVVFDYLGCLRSFRTS